MRTKPTPMEKPAVYEIAIEDFIGLVNHINKESTYEAHRYMGKILNGTIDNASTADFEECRQFSEFHSNEKETQVRLEVRDDKLADIVNAYLE